MKPKVKKHTVTEARQKIQRYCAYRERCHQEVEEKLYSFGLRRGEVDALVAELISDNFLNEERFAEAFAGGKFRQKRWGRNKIVQHLQQKRVSAYSIKKGLAEIEEEDYRNTMLYVLEKRWELMDESDLFVKKDKVAKYMIRRGFEPELVWKMLKEQKGS